jgi:hypothetical protein
LRGTAQSRGNSAWIIDLALGKYATLFIMVADGIVQLIGISNPVSVQVFAN